MHREMHGTCAPWTETYMKAHAHRAMESNVETKTSLSGSEGERCDLGEMAQPKAALSAARERMSRRLLVW
jgi:hypothetical protein